MPGRKKSNEPQYLYLTTTGRKTGLPRQIEIWFVSFGGKYYVLAEQRRAAQWVKNILRNSRVRVRVGNRVFDATARVLDEERDRATWERVQRLAREKYGWGDGLPVEMMPDKKDAPA